MEVPNKKQTQELFIAKCDFCNNYFYTKDDNLGKYPEKCQDCNNETNKIKRLIEWKQ